MRDNRGFTLIELLIVVGLVGVLAAIAAAALLRARIAGNEASAIGSLRAIVSSQIDYEALNRGYADSLDLLGVLCPGMTVPFLSVDLASNGIVKNGFVYSIATGAGGIAGPNDCNGTATTTAFYATAVAVSVGTTGNRGFAANQNAAIWQDTSGAAPVEPFVAAGTVSPIGK
jgi:type IV pilus assembly protein PilA